MKIIENVFSESVQNYIENFCFDQNFPWSFLKDSAHYSKDDYPSFGHLAVDNFNITSNVGMVFEIPVTILTEIFTLNRQNLIRERFGLYLPLVKKSLHNNIHIDMQEPHEVILYYVNESDGDTFFFDNNKNIIKRVTPKKGTAVFFDGNTFHASSNPSNNSRITLNLNYIK